MVPKKGKSKSAVAKKLGISSQLLGQYMAGRQQPKPGFYLKWKEVFGDDLLKKIETNVSHETEDMTNKAFGNLTEGTSFAMPKIMEQLMKEREATMEQLEARRNETEGRLIRAEADKDRLYKIIEDNLTAMLVSLNQNHSHLLDTRQLLSDVIAPQVTAHRKALETLLAGDKKSEKISASKSDKGLHGRKKIGDGKGSSH